MDEYLFLVAAKLEADRRRLEREQRLHLEAFEPQRIRPEADPDDVHGGGRSSSTHECREES